MIQRDPILITGIPRSGSSMIAAAINACGAFGGFMSTRGMYSNDWIRESVVIPYMNSVRSNIDGQYNFPIINSIPTQWERAIKEIILSEGYIEGPWMYKDSRITLLWQIWNYYYPTAKWLIVRRRTGDIVESCMKTGYMRAFKNPDIRKSVGVKTEEEGWLWMVHEYEKKFIQLIENKVDYRIIWPERMVNDDYDQLKEIVDWLGLQWNKDALNYIKPLLWGKQKERSK